MGAALVGDKELAIAGKGAIIEGDMVVIIVAMEGHVELVKAEAFAILGIAFGFFDLSNQTVVHF